MKYDYTSEFLPARLLAIKTPGLDEPEPDNYP
jgi:hypothetical protein